MSGFRVAVVLIPFFAKPALCLRKRIYKRFQVYYIGTQNCLNQIQEVNAQNDKNVFEFLLQQRDTILLLLFYFFSSCFLSRFLYTRHRGNCFPCLYPDQWTAI